MQIYTVRLWAALGPMVVSVPAELPMSDLRTVLVVALCGMLPLWPAHSQDAGKPGMRPQASAAVTLPNRAGQHQTTVHLNSNSPRRSRMNLVLTGTTGSLLARSFKGKPVALNPVAGQDPAGKAPARPPGRVQEGMEEAGRGARF
jgi:hypothetical protein